MKLSFTILFIYISHLGYTQVFENEELIDLVQKGADHIYNASPDSAYFYIDQVQGKLPNHPVVPLMRAMTLLWENIPTITEEVFLEMQSELYSAIDIAEKLDPDLKNPEMVFFTMASHGMLAEYYADQGYSMKALSEANSAYGLMKKGFEIVDDYPEFLLTTGLYNYFREKYPEKHPVYKPLLWFFRNGDIDLGIRQLEEASEKSIFSRVEADVYLSYIYLRYEYNPQKAQEHLAKLCEMFPKNYYAKAKYIESLANPVDFRKVPLEVIYSLIVHENPYYKLAGFVFLGYYEEKVIFNKEKAEYAYLKGLKFGEKVMTHGEYFKGFGYLGLARIQMRKRENEKAKESLNLAIEFSETEQIELEAKRLLSKL
ncbi:MAG: hypothetical protein AB8B73_04250 [Ekhidna sp.]